MKTISAAIFTTLFLIAPYAVSMPANSVFSFKNAALEITASKGEGKAKKPKKSRAKKGGGVTFHDGSAESRSERDRRLSRECKGRSNSGVCEGYTR